MHSRNSTRFGILCEDGTDAKALGILIRRIASAAGATQGEVGLRSRHGEGCGNLRKKAAIWAKDLADSGCDAIVLVHDLDRSHVTNQLNDEAKLRKELDAILVPTEAYSSHICIPIEEFEAWFFSCSRVMRAISGKDGQTHANPHSIERPKEKLIGLSRGANRKPRFSTNDNAKYAEMLDLDACARLCPSFRDLRHFVMRHTGAPERISG
jgi:hypothetical protein